MNKIPINETFISIQGEGHFTGTPAFFIRTAGCDLTCPFCDTNHQLVEEKDIDELVHVIRESGLKHVVITGGEPTMHLSALQHLVNHLVPIVKHVQIETNGFVDISKSCSDAWLTLSPKGPHNLPAHLCHEVKLLIDSYGRSLVDIPLYNHYHHIHKFFQPMDPGDKNIPYLERVEPSMTRIRQLLVSYPTWRVSLQTHKLFGWR